MLQCSPFLSHDPTPRRRTSIPRGPRLPLALQLLLRLLDLLVPHPHRLPKALMPAEYPRLGAEATERGTELQHVRGELFSGPQAHGFTCVKFGQVKRLDGRAREGRARQDAQALQEQSVRSGFDAVVVPGCTGGLGCAG